jgi:hypothetical protein
MQLLTCVVQLLDEVMDSGYPFTTEPGLLRTLVQPLPLMYQPFVRIVLTCLQVHNPSVVQKALTASGIRFGCFLALPFIIIRSSSHLSQFIPASATATVGDTLPDSYLRSPSLTITRETLTATTKQPFNCSYKALASESLTSSHISSAIFPGGPRTLVTAATGVVSLTNCSDF